MSKKFYLQICEYCDKFLSKGNTDLCKICRLHTVYYLYAKERNFLVREIDQKKG